MSNSPVMKFFNKLADLILLNALFIICCLPVVTIGAAITAMYYVNIVSIRQGDGYVFKRFFASFKENLKQATILWFLALGILSVLVADVYFWLLQGTLFAKVMFVVSLAVAMAVGIVLLYLFPCLAKLRGSVFDIIRYAASFAYGYLPYTLVLVAITAGFTFANIKSAGMNLIMLFVGFATVTYIKSFFIYRVMMNHIPERYDDFIKDAEYTEEEHDIF